jgi:hypothetical protein
VEQARLGKRVVVVIDEAQNLDDSVLELVRMLSNFETSREKLIQIVLSGQPQLAEKIASPGLEQLRQRVSIFACLKPLSREDTALYIDHRLRVAGLTGDAPLFTKEALALIGEHSEGISRNINNLCFNALTLGCALRRKPIDGKAMREVIADLDLGRWRRSSVVAALPADARVKHLPGFLADAGEGRARNWLSKLAIAMTVLLATGGALFAIHRWSAPKTVQAVVASRRSAPTTPVLSPPYREPKAEAARPDGAIARAESAPPVIPATEVQVTPGRTLLGICVENYGGCNAQLLEEIHLVNPRLNTWTTLRRDRAFGYRLC